MKIIQFEKDNKIYYGKQIKNIINPINGDIFESFKVDQSSSIDISGVKILPPVFPSKIIAIGLNYKDHAIELGEKLPDEPKLFIKPSTSIIGYGDNIIYPPSSKRVDYEAELSAVVKKRAHNIPVENAKEYILGYTCLNDVTARDLQQKDVQWTRSKSFDTFCPIGPVIETELDPDNLNIYSRLNGKVKQSYNTKNFIFPMFELFSFISNIMTLLPGDIITTGTPSGIGPMKPGDIIEIEVEGIGVLRNNVVEDK